MRWRSVTGVEDEGMGENGEGRNEDDEEDGRLVATGN